MKHLVVIFAILGLSTASPFLGWLFPKRTTTTVATTTTTASTSTTASPEAPESDSNLNGVDEAALAIINEYRTKNHAPAVTYNTTLRDAAQACADAYAAADQISPPCGTNSNLGETNGVSSLHWASLGAIDAVNEIAKTESSLVDSNSPTLSASTANYTQMIWQSTTQVGCAYSSSEGSSIGHVLTCLWSPPVIISEGTTG